MNGYYKLHIYYNKEYSMMFKSRELETPPSQSAANLPILKAAWSKQQKLVIQQHRKGCYRHL